MSRLSRTQERPFWPKPPGRLSSFEGSLQIAQVWFVMARERRSGQQLQS
jgi:hypothetical protein